jgi:hypothetical protein
MSADVLRTMEAALNYQARTDKPIERSQAAAFAHVLRRLLADDAVVAALEAHSAIPEISAKQREFWIGLSYRIRFELAKVEAAAKGLSTRGLSTRARGQTAQRWGCPDGVVSTYASRHKIAIDAWLVGMEHRVRALRKPASSSLAIAQARSRRAAARVAARAERQRANRQAAMLRAGLVRVDRHSRQQTLRAPSLLKRELAEIEP